MPSAPQPPTGAARRRTRISDAETERRMLDAAVALITERGMSVSLEHLSLEEIIQAAGVARTSVYRRWPYKDLFFSDLLVELARASALGSGYGSMPELLVAFLEGLLPRPTDIDTEQDRLDVTVDIFRISGLADFQAVYASHEWRTHIALHATHLGLPDSDLRSAVGEALSAAERRFTEARADAYRRLARLWGYRYIGETFGPGDGFMQLSLAIGSAMMGLVIKAFANPALLHERQLLAPFGTSRKAEWSAPALVLSRIALSYLEPDPAVAWGDDRIRSMIEEIRVMTSGDAQPPG